MPFTLIPPGRRKGNPFYLIRGTIGGRDFEISTKTRDKSAARQFAREFAQKYEESRLPSPGETITFRRAALAYAEYRGLDLEDTKHPDVKRIKRLTAVLGDLLVSDIVLAHLIEAANRLQPRSAAATKNREVMRVGAAILHYAAENKWCAWLRIKLFKEPRPKTRAVTADMAIDVIAAAPEGYRRLFLLWSFKQGTRVSETLRVQWTHIDLPSQRVGFYDRKNDQWIEAPLDAEVFEELAALPQTDRAGYLFPWRTRSGVYKWLKPLMRETGIKFTPHMARHSLGKWLNESGSSLRTIMDTLRHKDPKSSIRYQSTDVEIIRAAVRRTGELSGNTRRKAQNI